MPSEAEQLKRRVGATREHGLVGLFSVSDRLAALRTCIPAAMLARLGWTLPWHDWGGHRQRQTGGAVVTKRRQPTAVASAGRLSGSEMVRDRKSVV